MLDVGRVRELAERVLSSGEAPPGTAAEEAVASVVEEELERRGLSVERQEFRCASWTEESVWLSVDGAEVPAVALPPSPSGYVEGELVHVRSVLGAGDLDGKVALVGMAREDPDHAASLYALLAKAGASAVVFYDFHPRVLRRIVVGIFASYREGPGLPPPIPAVAVRLDDGRRLAEGAHYAQLEVRARYSEDSRSRNLLAVEGEPTVLLSAHLDRWLGGAADDGVGVALLLAALEELRGVRGVGLAFFGAEEYGAPLYNPWYWAWGSRVFVERLLSTGEAEGLVALINVDVAARRPLTISASGPEFREAARALLGGTFEYDLDSPYFDSFSFSSAGIAALTVHSLWRYVDLYHTDHDTLGAVDWSAVGEAGGAIISVAREVARRGTSFFRYEAWKLELLERLSRASELLEPPPKLVGLVKSLSVDERAARVLRAKAIRPVREGEWYEPGILHARAFPELLVLDDWELARRAAEAPDSGGVERLRTRWTVGRVQELPSIPLGLAVPRGGGLPPGYRRELERVARAWLERVYAQLEEMLEGLPRAV